MKKTLFRTFSLLLCAALLLPLLPTCVLAAGDGEQTVLDITKGDIVIGDGTVSGYAADGTAVTAADADGYHITGSAETHHTVTVTGGTHNITISYIDISAPSSDVSPFLIETGASVKLTVRGENEIFADSHSAAICVEENAYLNITEYSTGTLNVQGGVGIGQVNGDCGYISIDGGTITAIGKMTNHPALGRNKYHTDGTEVSPAYAGTVGIYGGTLTLTGAGSGSSHSAAIQAKSYTIYGGNVNATAPTNADNYRVYTVSGLTEDKAVMSLKLENDFIWGLNGMNTIGGKLYMVSNSQVTSVKIGSATYYPSAEDPNLLVCPHTADGTPEGTPLEPTKTDNMDGTHTLTYPCCGYGVTGAHDYDPATHLCVECGYIEYAASALVEVDTGSPVTKKFHTLEEAIAAAKEEEYSNVTLLRDLTLTQPVVFEEGNINFDLKDNDLTTGNGFVGDAAIIVKENASLTFKGGEGRLYARNVPAIKADTAIRVNGGCYESTGDTLFLLNHTSGTSIFADGLFTTLGSLTFGLADENTKLTIGGGRWNFRLAVGTVSGSASTLQSLLAENYFLRTWEGTLQSADVSTLTAPDSFFTVSIGADLDKDAVVTLDQSTFLYDGTTHRPTVTVEVNGQALDPDFYTIIYPTESVGAGDYQVEVRGFAPYDGKVALPYKIEPMPLSASWGSKYVFESNCWDPQGPTLSLRDSYGNPVSTAAAKVTLLYKPRGADDSAYTSEKPWKAGSYTVKAELNDPNYVLENNTFDYTVNWSDSVPAPIVSGTPGPLGWYQSATLVAADNTYITLNVDNIAFGTNSFDLDPGVYDRVYARSASGYVSCHTINVQVDSTPADAAITVKDVQWKSVLNTVTFGLFFKNSQTVTVTAADEESGVHLAQYALTDGTAPAEGDWLNYNGSFNVDPTRKFVVWARVTNGAGSQTAVNSDGIVVYTDSTTDTASLSFTLGSDAQLSFTFRLNGNALGNVTLDGTELNMGAGFDYTYAGDGTTGTVTLTTACLNGLSAGGHTLKVGIAPAGVPFAEGEHNDAPAELTIPLTVEKCTPVLSVLHVYDKVYNGMPITVGLPDVDYGSLANPNPRIKVEYKKQGADDNTYTTDAPADAGSYTARFTLMETDRTVEVSVTADYTISPIPVTATWSNTQLFYNSQAQGPSATVMQDGTALSSDLYTVKAGLSADPATHGTLMPTAAGSYYASVAMKTGNYAISDGSGQCTFTISWADVEQPTLDGTLGNNGWYTAATVDAADLTTVSLHPDGPFHPFIDLKDGVYDDLTVYVKDIATDTVGKAQLGEVKVDSKAPAALITVGENRWNTLLNSITFGLFFKNTQSVTVIGANDPFGGAVTEYALTEGSRPADSDWQEYNGSFNVDPSRKFVVWARVTDPAGNETLINSSGIVVYADAETDATALSYTRGSREDVTFPVLLNGSTVKDVRLNDITSLLYTVSPADANGNATVSLDGDYLDSFAADDYTLVLSFDPMGESYVDADGNAAPAELTVPLTVKKFAPVAEPFSVDDHVYDGWSAPIFGVMVNDWGGNTELSLYSVAEYKVQGASDDTWTETAPTDVGNYTVRITIQETDRTEAIVVMADYAITPKTVYSYNNVVEDKPYDGTTVVPYFRLDSWGGFIDGDDVSVDAANAAAAFASADAGSFIPVTISGYALVGADAHNYVLHLPTMSADITPLDIASAEYAAEATTFTYDGSEKALALTSVKVNGLDATYTVTGDKATDAGAYTATLTGTGNFTGTLSVDYAILPDTSILTGLTGDNAKLADKEALEKLFEQLTDLAESDNDAIDRGLRDELAAAQNALGTDILPGLDAWEKLVTPVLDAVDSLPEAIPDDPDAVAALDALNEALARLTDEEQQRFAGEFPAVLEQAAAFAAAMTDYRFTSGDGQHWSLVLDRGTDAVFKTNGYHEKLTAVIIGDVTLSADDYTVEAGSTVITVKAAYLNTLKVGTYPIVAEYTDGEACGVLIVCDDTCPDYEAPGMPDTGDHSHLWLWLALTLIPAAALSTLLALKRREER